MKRVLITFVIAAASLALAPVFTFGGPEIPSDQEIKKNVVEQLVWDDRVDAAGIEVEVEFAQVTLTGTVPSHFSREAAIADVWSVRGVVSVVDNLTVEPSLSAPIVEPLAAEVKGALLVDSQLDAADITVSSAGGLVTLGGKVQALWQKYRAEDIASGVNGVLGIINEIAVVPGEDIKDEVIAQDIIRAIERNSNVDVNSVNVTVNDGYVTLTGTVDDRTAREAAYQVAIHTLGVKGVTNELFVETGIEPLYTDSEIAQAVRDQLLWDNQVDASKVIVDVHDGRVTLSGTVPTYSAKLAAESDTLMTKGVVSLQNELEVQPTEPIASDVFLAERAQDVLSWNPEIKIDNLDVRVIAGIATIKGEVDTLWKKYRAQVLVSDVKGIIDVINEIAVVPTKNILDETIATDIVKAIDRNIHVNVEDVTVRVDHGTVTLSGVVPSVFSKDAAFEAALDTAGVRAIINNLKVGS